MRKVLFLISFILLLCESVFAQTSPYNAIYDQIPAGYKGSASPYSGPSARWMVADQDYTEGDISVTAGDMIIYATDGSKGELVGQTNRYSDNKFPWARIKGIKRVFVVDTLMAAGTAHMFHLQDSEVEYIDLSGLNTSNTKDMTCMFFLSPKLKKIVFGNMWNVEKVTTFAGMFSNCTGLESVDLSKFINTNALTDIGGMFYQCSRLSRIEFNEKFSTRRVSDFGGMFSECGRLTSLDLSMFNTSNATNMSYMFDGCYFLSSIDFGENFTTEKVTDFSYMFRWVALKSLDLSNFSFASATDVNSMFDHATILENITFGEGAITDNVEDFSYMFANCKRLQSLDISMFNTKSATTTEFMFYMDSLITSIKFGDKFTTENVTDMKDMFLFCYNLQALNVKMFNTKNVTNMSGMFGYCQKLTSLNLSNFNTENVSDMSSMFTRTFSLDSLDLTSFNTGNVTDMSYMFRNCHAKSIKFGENFNTENVITMSYMFCYMQKVDTLDLSNFNTSNVKNMDGLFYGSKVKSVKFGENFKTDQATSMSMMFYYCINLTELDLSTFSSSKTTNQYLFESAPYTLNKITFGENWKSPEKLPYSMYCDRQVPAVSVTLTDGQTHTYTKALISNINANILNGKGSIDVVEFADYGAEVSVTVEPEVGYKLVSLTSDDVEINDGKFIMPATDVSINVTFEQIFYDITFKDEDGSVLDCSGKVAYGTVPSCAAPKKAATDDYIYEFKEWTPAVEAAYQDAEYTAVYAATRLYQINFYNENGSILSCSGKVPEGVTPSCTSPKKSSTKEYDYTFLKWTPDLVAAEKDADYTATFKEKFKEYYVSFLDEKGNTIELKSYHYKDSLVVPEIPQKPADNYCEIYEFSDWLPTVSMEVLDHALYKATYVCSKPVTYQINFYDENGDLYDCSGEVKKGVKPSCPNAKNHVTEGIIYTFLKWTPDIVSAEKDADYVAIFNEEPMTYKVVFVDYAAKDISINSYHYKDSLIVPDAPQKPADRYCENYVFSQWTPELSLEVVEGRVYFPQYDCKPIEESSSSVVESSSSIESSSSEEQQAIWPSIAMPASFSIHVSGKTIQISEAPENASYVLMDVLGKVLKAGVSSANFNIEVTNAGAYILKIGSKLQKVKIK